MTPLMRKVSDFGIILAVIAGLAFAIIAGGNSLASKSSLWHSYNIWWNFIFRPDIVVTTLIAVAVSLGFTTYRQTGGRR